MLVNQIETQYYRKKSYNIKYGIPAILKRFKYLEAHKSVFWPVFKLNWLIIASLINFKLDSDFIMTILMSKGK